MTVSATEEYHQMRSALRRLMSPNLPQSPGDGIVAFVFSPSLSPSHSPKCSQFSANFTNSMRTPYRLAHVALEGSGLAPFNASMLGSVSRVNTAGVLPAEIK